MAIVSGKNHCFLMVRSNGFGSFLRTWKLYLFVLDLNVLEEWHKRGWKVQQNVYTAILQKLTWPRLDLNCWAAPDVLLHLRHTLSSCLVGVICGTNCDLVLNTPLALQVIPALPLWERTEKREDLSICAYDFSGSAPLTGCLSNISVRDYCRHTNHFSDLCTFLSML